MRKLMISVLAGSLTVAGASAQVKAYKPSKPMEGNTVAYATTCTRTTERGNA